MLVCAIDFETTGFDPKADKITEVGAAILDCDDNFKVVDEFSSIVWEPGYPKLSPEVQEVTGLTDAILEKEGRPLADVFIDLHKMMDSLGVSAFIAHNASFDESFYRAAGNEKYNWYCTYEDMEHPKKITCRKLSHMALDYGVPIDPKDLHRALGDVKVMAQVLSASGTKIEDIITYSQIPFIVIQALVPHPREDNGRGKDEAKKNGFGWGSIPRFHHSPPYPNMWVKRIKKNKLDEERAKFPYKLKVL